MAVERLPPPPMGQDGSGPFGRHLASIKRVIDWLLTRHDLGTRRVQSATISGTTTAIALSATTVNVEHGLGRTFRGWRVIDRDASVTIYRDTTAPVPDATKFLPLQATGNVNAVIEVW